MIQRVLAALLFGCFLSGVALAAPGITIGGASMRAGPGRGPVIDWVPAGAPVELFECADWCLIAFAGTYGYIPAHLISGGYTAPARRDYFAAPGYPWSPEQPPSHVLLGGVYGGGEGAADTAGWGHVPATAHH